MKRAVVLGAGVTGVSLARFLKSSGYDVICLDENRVDSDELNALGVPLFCKPDFPKLSPDALVVTSPGVNPQSELVKFAGPGISEFDLARFSPQIGVTGTNGKTTVVSMISSLLGAEAVGNIGKPVVDRESEGPFVCEYSSYQLYWTNSCFPETAVITNIGEDHLCWHGGAEGYRSAKEKIAKNDWTKNVVLPTEEQKLKGELRNKRIVTFGSTQGADVMVSKGLAAIGGASYELPELKIFGQHNFENLAAAFAAGLCFGAKLEPMLEKSSLILPISHRLELVPSREGRVVINDSKATNLASVKIALRAVGVEYPGRQIVLLLGGRDKGESWESLRPALGSTEVVCFGEAGKKIHSVVGGLLCFSLSDALDTAQELLKTNGVLLLSPGCASFDEFANFEERGDYFKQHIEV